MRAAASWSTIPLRIPGSGGDFATRGMAASSFERGLRSGGGEALIPEVDGEADSVRIGDFFSIFVGLD